MLEITILVITLGLNLAIYALAKKHGVSMTDHI
jgi:hypothetical protein